MSEWVSERISEGCTDERVRRGVGVQGSGCSGEQVRGCKGARRSGRVGEGSTVKQRSGCAGSEWMNE